MFFVFSLLISCAMHVKEPVKPRQQPVVNTVPVVTYVHPDTIKINKPAEPKQVLNKEVEKLVVQGKENGGDADYYRRLNIQWQLHYLKLSDRSAFYRKNQDSLATELYYFRKALSSKLDKMQASNDANFAENRNARSITKATYNMFDGVGTFALVCTLLFSGTQLLFYLKDRNKHAVRERAL